MNYPRIDTERERGNIQLLLIDSNFNPVLHESEEALHNSKKRRGTDKHYKCECGETNPENYYHYICKYSGNRNPVGKCKKCYSLKNKLRYKKPIL